MSCPTCSTSPFCPSNMAQISPQTSNHLGGGIFSTLANIVTDFIPTASPSRCDDDRSINLYDPDADDDDDDEDQKTSKAKHDKKAKATVRTTTIQEEEVFELGVDVGDANTSEVFTASRYLFDPDDDQYDVVGASSDEEKNGNQATGIEKPQQTKLKKNQNCGGKRDPLDDSISTTDVEDSSYNHHREEEDVEASSSTGRPPSHPHALRRRPSLHEFKKYKTYSLKVEKYENDKATEIKFCNFQRPHMRAFYCAWFSFLIAYVNWFAIAPLLPVVRDSLDLSREEIWTSSIASIPLATILRFTVGPLCDKYGARWVMMWILILASIPTACTGLVQTGLGLSIVRLFSGIGGSAFVMTQFWANAMFSKRIVGTASAIVGNSVEVGVTQLFMGSVLFPFFQNILGETDEVFGDGEDAEAMTSNAWRYVTIVPAIMTFITGIAVYFGSDDTPKVC